MYDAGLWEGLELVAVKCLRPRRSGSGLSLSKRHPGSRPSRMNLERRVDANWRIPSPPYVLDPLYGSAGAVPLASFDAELT